MMGSGRRLGTLALDHDGTIASGARELACARLPA